MKARLPQGYGGGPQNQKDMLRQAQKLQEEMASKRAELQEREYTAASGGQMVEVTVNGKKELKSLKLKPEIVDPDEIEMLEDMIMAAVNEGMRMADEASEREMAQITGGFSLPGVF